MSNNERTGSAGLDASTDGAPAEQPSILERALKTAGSDALKYAPVRFIPALTSLVTVPLFTAAISTEDYGAFYLISSATALLANVATGWLSSSSIRFYWICKRENRIDEYTSTILWAAIGALSATAGVALVAAFLFGNMLDPLVLRLVPVASVYFVANFLTNVLVQVLRAAKRPGAFARMQIGGAILTTALSIVAVWYARLGSAGILAGVALGWTLMLIPMLREIGKEGSLAPRAASRRLLGEFWSYGAPLVLVSVATWSLVLLDRWVIGAFRGPAEVGVYSVVYALGDKIMQLVTAPLLLSMTPSLTEAYEMRGQALAEKVQAEFLRYFSIVTFPLIVGMAVAAQPFIRVFVDPRYAEGWTVLPLVAAGSMLSSFAQVAGTGLGLHKQTKRIMLNTVTAAVSNFALNLLTVPRFGYMAAAVNTIVSYAILLGLTTYQSRRYMKLIIPWDQLLRIAGASLGMGAAVLLVFGRIAQSASRTASVGIVAGEAALGAAVYLVLLVAFGGLHRKEIGLLRRLAVRMIKRG